MGLRVKPVLCLQALPLALAYLPAEWSALILERTELETKPNPTQADLTRAAAIDDRLMRILLDLHAQDGGLYQIAINHLAECQAWIKETP